MTWMSRRQSASLDCCPWPEHCACARARRAHSASRERGDLSLPSRGAAPWRAPQDANLQRSGDSWEQVLQRLAAEQLGLTGRARPLQRRDDRAARRRPRA